jgi:hypothetical protein
LRHLWPRLAVAAGTTLLVMSGLLFLLIRAVVPGEHRRQETALASKLEEAPAPMAAPQSTSREPAPPAPQPGPVAHSPPPSAPVPDGPADNPPRSASPVVRRTPDVKEAPAVAEGPAAVWREGDQFYQEVVVGRVSGYHVLDNDLRQNVQYAFVSRFTVGKRVPAGGLAVRQKVAAVRLANADPALQARLNTLLQGTRGATFTMTLDPREGVTGFKGDKEAVRVFAGADALGNPSFLLWSFLDQDGWKELAQVTFFQPEGPPRAGAKWSRKVLHSWGPLGSWAGQATYAYAAHKAGLDRYQYRLDLAYRPPRKGDDTLPFQVGKADFRVPAAGGTIAYDAGRRRVAAAEERFHVRGVLAVSVLDLTAPVEMEEVQVFQVRILDRNPWESSSPGTSGRGP